MANHPRKTIRDAVAARLLQATRAQDRVFKTRPRNVPWRRIELPGIAVYNTTPATAAAKIKAARALGFPELALFSYDALAKRPGYWPRLRADLGGARGRDPRARPAEGLR